LWFPPKAGRLHHKAGKLRRYPVGPGWGRSGPGLTRGSRGSIFNIENSGIPAYALALKEVDVPSTAFDKLVHDMRLLTPQERERIREVLDGKANGEAMSEDDFERLLVDVGFLAPLPGPAVSTAWEPVVVEGERVSDTIIRERR